MSALRTRISRLERQDQGEGRLPYVVFRELGESAGEAISRTLNGTTPPPGWRCILAPGPMTLEDWIAANSPQHPAPIENPR